ncbi:D-beta-hydroxybutyrate dehydrogenase, mitochondrial-like [Erythrolamprus reginae]|uniref:D-beta-hydroxybutyrate dehydrogenase, mitochondrial-like n=1 Tax=Erythrolamprus reginae TaxID=121349 RepID=UPI00396C585A
MAVPCPSSPPQIPGEAPPPQVLLAGEGATDSLGGQWVVEGGAAGGQLGSPRRQPLGLQGSFSNRSWGLLSASPLPTQGFRDGGQSPCGAPPSQGHVLCPGQPRRQFVEFNKRQADTWLGPSLCQVGRSVCQGQERAKGKAVLITGCDKGFGHALANRLYAEGFTVFAGCLLLDQGGDGARELRCLGPGRMHVVQLDVCCEEQVARALRYVQAQLEDPAQGLWGLVNNAGVASFGDVEFTSLEKYQRVAEVNLWGTIRVTKAFLPLIRRARGRVVNLSSMLGRMARPMRSSYCISKFGVEAFSDCLRQEMYCWGVSVVAIEPSNFIAATGILTPGGIEAEAEGMWLGASEALRSEYGESDFREKLARMKGFAHSGLRDASLVLDALSEALSAPRPCSRYTPMEASWWLRLQAATHLPTPLADWLFVR